MNKSTSYLPTTKDLWDLAKMGSVLYLTGLVVTFIYYTQLHIFSADLLKANAIVLGVYVWLYADTIPRALLIKVKSNTTGLQIVYIVLLALFYIGVTRLIRGVWDWQTWLFSTLATVAASLYFLLPPTQPSPVIPKHADTGTEPLTQETPGNTGEATAASSTGQSIARIGLFVGILACLFALSLYGRIPQYVGGGKPLPVRVQIKPEDSLLIKSRFIQEDLDKENCYWRDLLYESDKDYYFVEPVPDATTHLVYEVRIHKIKKDLIRKIIFTKPNWLGN